MFANRLLGTVQNMVLSAEGKFNFLEGTDFHFARLRLWIDGFAEVHRQLYVGLKDVSEEETRLNREAVVQVHDLHEGSYRSMDTW